MPFLPRHRSGLSRRFPPKPCRRSLALRRESTALHRLVIAPTARTGFAAATKKIDVSDAVYAALQRLASDFHRTPGEVLAHLLHLPHASTAAAAPIAAFILGPDSRAQFTAADHDLALLRWIAVRHAEEFAEFIRLKRASHRRRCASGWRRGHALSRP